MATKTNLPSYIKLNTKVRPQDDFYAHVCHHWRQSNPRPKTKGRWGHFSQLTEQTDAAIRDIIETWVADDSKLNSSQKQVVDYFNILCNIEKHQTRSVTSLKRARNQLLKIAALSEDSKAALLATATKWSIASFFEFDADLDNKNNQRYCLHLSPPEFDLPGREYYLSPNKHMKQMRSAYLDFLKKHQQAFQAVGFDYNLEPKRIFALEKSLARASLTVEKACDPEITYNLYSGQDFLLNFDFNWSTYFTMLGLQMPQDIIVTDVDYFKSSLKQLAKMSALEIAEYLIHKLTIDFGSVISDKLHKVQFDFFSKILAGVNRRKPVRQRNLNACNQTFPDTVGRAYVQQYFPANYKKAVEKIAQQVSDAFGERLAQNSWMSDVSRRYAQAKLQRISVNIGYSEHWAKYTTDKFVADDPFATVLHMNQVHVQKCFDLLHQRPNRQRFGEISEDVQIVNAWTNLSLLNTNYPAGYLQKPFYDHDAIWEYNLGVLGSTIGHELSHNFDQNGSRYDQSGHLNPWLNSVEQKAFKRAAAKLMRSASKHHVAPNTKLKGRQVLGELIADLAGLEIILDVVKKRYTTPAQRDAALKKVFIAYAFQWAINESLEMKILSAKTGVHPDAVFRVNGILSHCDDFHRIFQVKPTDNMYLKPKLRAKIW